MNKQLLLLTLLLLSAATASAVEKKINGLWYELVYETKEAKVIPDKNDVEYSGNIVIPDAVEYGGVTYSVTSIEVHAFSYCSGLISVTIPNSVTIIGEYAFYGCDGLTSVTIPNSVTSIGSHAFWCCSGLTSVTIPNSVTSIGWGAFSHCSGLISVTIPNSVTSIGSGTFEGCSSLTSVTIPNSVTSIGSSTFEGCSSLTSVTIPNSVTSIGEDAFHECSGLTSITIGNSVTSIGVDAFARCSSLTSVTIPNSVTSIGGVAFYECSSLTSVTIGSGIKEIGSKAFAFCPEITDFLCYARWPPVTQKNAFERSYVELSTLHVPTETIDAYKITEPWKNFKTIVGLNGTLPDNPEPGAEQCATPTISYGSKRLSFSCATEGVEYVYEIRDADVRKGYDSEVTLTGTYEISVYATKAGYSDSDIATALLVWGSATFTETTPEQQSVPTLTVGTPALVTAREGLVSVSCATDGLPVAVYTTDGKLIASASVADGLAVLPVTLPAGSLAIVRLGQQSVKVVMR